MVLDEELRTLELHASRVANGLAHLDAEHDVLGVGVIFTEVVAVVGSDQWYAEIFFELEQARMDFVLHLKALVLNLEEEVLLAEDVRKRGGRRARGVVVAFG